MGENKSNGSVTVKLVVIGLLIVFSVTLAVEIGKRMSENAMAVVIGVVCGVAAAIPTTMLVTRMVWSRAIGHEKQAPAPAAPPMYFMFQGGQPTQGFWPAPGMNMPALPAGGPHQTIRTGDYDVIGESFLE